MPDIGVLREQLNLMYSHSFHSGAVSFFGDFVVGAGYFKTNWKQRHNLRQSYPLQSRGQKVQGRMRAGGLMAGSSKWEQRCLQQAPVK
jgi:hypothetical protein